MASPFDNMSDEQILALLREASKEPGQEPAKPAENPFRVTIAGETLEAASADELNKLIQAKFDAANVRPVAEEKPVPQREAPPKFDMDTFVKKFTTDPDDGLEYLEVAKYGMPVRKAVPQMLAITAALAQKVQELESASFAPQDAGERAAVERIMRERQWQPSRQAFQDALDIAKARGFVKAPVQQEEERQLPPRNERGQFIPPRVPRATTEETASENEAEILRAAQTMSLGKLENILFDAGVIKARRT